METLAPSVFVQIGGEVVVRIDQVNVIVSTGLDVLVGLIGGGLVIPELEVSRGSLFLSGCVFLQNSKVARGLGCLLPMKSLGEFFVADLGLRWGGCCNAWHI